MPERVHIVHRPYALDVDRPKQRLLLRFEQVHPIVRLAHRMTGALRIPERIIYDHELVFIADGRTALWIGGRRIEAPEETLLIIPPFTPHSFESNTDCATCVHIAVHFDFCAGTPIWSDDPNDMRPYEIIWPEQRRLPQSISLNAHDGIARSLADIVALAESRDEDPLASAEAATLLQMVLLKILRRPSLSDAIDDRSGASDAAYQVNRRRIGAALNYIRERLGEPIQLNDLADAASMSRSRFASLFREFTGESPQHYIQSRRIALARRLLAQPDLSIKEIAAQTGFEDSFYFSRVFRRADGLTPSQYRAAALAGRFPFSEPTDPE